MDLGGGCQLRGEEAGFGLTSIRHGGAWVLWGGVARCGRWTGLDWDGGSGGAVAGQGGKAGCGAEGVDAGKAEAGWVEWWAGEGRRAGGCLVCLS